ncbi:nitroreductase family protein [Buchananella hordeovulneris]|uniref:nitroreductase family protein n=1 Tax=Buchananella hordeovulneris TaxID=52770 RepID=UPI0011610C79|nr:nitroreductase family protein [Buchananella hordeovulneris]
MELENWPYSPVQVNLSAIWEALRWHNSPRSIEVKVDSVPDLISKVELLQGLLQTGLAEMHIMITEEKGWSEELIKISCLPSPLGQIIRSKNCGHIVYRINDRVRIQGVGHTGWVEIPIEAFQYLIADSETRQIDTMSTLIDLMFNVSFGASRAILETPDHGWPEQLFHVYSRLWRSTQLGIEYGATYSELEKVQTQYQDRSDLKSIKLPDWRRKSDLLDDRMSRRDYLDKDINLEDLGYLLGPIMFARKVWCNEQGLEIVHRGIPGAGGLAAIEVFLLLNSRPEALSYRYDWRTHELKRLDIMSDELLRRLNKFASASLNIKTCPPGILLIAGNLEELRKKYSGISYASMLKQVGALMMALQLVGRQLNIGLCPLGSSPTDLFEESLMHQDAELQLVGEMAFGYVS